MFTDRLKTLVAYKRQVEDGAAQALGLATAARMRAEGAEASLVDALGKAQAALTAQRSSGVPEGPERAVDGAGRQRFAARLADRVRACAQRLANHRQAVVEPALRAEEDARDRHLAACQDREAIEKHWEEQRAAAAKQTERKQEAAQDDRGTPRGGK
ncbi:MAG TPA: hypothetical protein VFH73_22410 [Polyangia bacterium]|nr:hypothetical protein [Polyangia bacterium]